MWSSETAGGDYWRGTVASDSLEDYEGNCSCHYSDSDEYLTCAVEPSHPTDG